MLNDRINCLTKDDSQTKSRSRDFKRFFATPGKFHYIEENLKKYLSGKRGLFKLVDSMRKKIMDYNYIEKSTSARAYIRGSTLSCACIFSIGIKIRKISEREKSRLHQIMV